MREARIRLSPPELGEIVIRVRVEGNEVTTRVESSRSDVRGLLESMRSDLGRGLQEAGLRLARLEIGASRPEEAGRFMEMAGGTGTSGSGHGGGTSDRQGSGPMSGQPTFGTGLGNGGSGQSGDPASSQHATPSRAGAVVESNGRTDGNESGVVTRSGRADAAIDAW
jgi:hypothetical protein